MGVPTALAVMGGVKWGLGHAIWLDSFNHCVTSAERNLGGRPFADYDGPFDRIFRSREEGREEVGAFP